MTAANVLALQRPYPWVTFKVTKRLEQNYLPFSAPQKQQLLCTDCYSDISSCICFTNFQFP